MGYDGNDFGKSFHRALDRRTHKILDLIRQEPIPGKKHGARWIATFSPDLIALLRHVTLEKDCPDSVTLEFLSHGIWTIPKSEVSAVIEEVPRYEQLASTFNEMHENGASIQIIASAQGLCWDQAKMILHFAETGERPKWPSKQKRSPTSRNVIMEKYESICPEVVKRKASGETFAKIARELHVCESTVRRAWDHAHQEQLKDAATSGTTPNRGSYRHIPEAKIREVQSLLKEGKLTIREIVSRSGLSQSTVRREKRRKTGQ